MLSSQLAISIEKSRVYEELEQRVRQRLGLSIVHQIVEEHRGRVSIESELGAGTSVRLELPLEGPRPPARSEARAQD